MKPPLLIRLLSPTFVYLAPVPYNFFVPNKSYLTMCYFCFCPLFSFLGSAKKALLRQFEFPLTRTETRCYTHHVLSYEQSVKVGAQMGS